MITRLKQALRRSRLRRSSEPDSFLGEVSGVVHIGANLGQERDLYASLGLEVVWVEPIPKIFAQLQENIATYPGQRALQHLLTDKADQEIDFHIANNDGASSSILELGEHRDIWPNIHYTETIRIRSSTLEDILESEAISPRRYQALVLDTQGSELLVLKGAGQQLEQFRFIKTEAPDFESYQGCCRLDDLSAFLADRGFQERSRTRFAEREEGGSYYDVVFEQRS